MLSISSQHSFQQALSRILLLRVLALSLALVIIFVFEARLGRSILGTKLILALFGACAFCFATFLRLRRKTPVSLLELSIHLLADALLLITLVVLTGGATNPFIYYYLVLIGVAAAALPQMAAWLYCGSAVLAYSLLMYLDLGALAHHGLNDFQLHLLGMWFNFVGSAALMCLFVSRFSNALREREAALSQVREKNLRNEQLIGIGTIATSTAHRLATPLNSISIILSELNTHSDAETEEDIQLAQTQIQRAKNTLKNLQALADPEENISSTNNLKELSNVLQEHYLLVNSEIQPQLIFADEYLDRPVSVSLLLQHALINLIDNAIRSAKSSVRIMADFQNDMLRLIIEDDGEGFTKQQLENWGQPMQNSEGLGIGIFLANHSIENFGGHVFATRTSDNKTRITVQLPINNNSSFTANE